MSAFRGPRWRHRAVLVALALACGVVGHRLVVLQVVMHERIVARADSQFEKLIDIPGPRGEIVDRHGRVLAMSVPTEKVFVVPRNASGKELERLERFAGKRGQLTKHRDSAWRKLFESCDARCQERLDALLDSGEISKGVLFRIPSYRRHYPLKEVASSLLGFVSFDGERKAGLERSHDELLRATVRRVKRMQDAHGGAFDHPNAPPLPNQSSSLMLTIDLRIQRVLERELLATMRHHGAKGADGVVLDPYTGEIFAMASLPYFDPNRYNRASEDERSNGAIIKAFEPGSVVKPLVAAGLIEHDLYRAGRRVDCEMGRWRAHTRVITDVKPYRLLTMPEVIKVSSNIGMAKFARDLSAKQMHATYEAFGFGQQTGIRLPGESSGKLHAWDEWKPVEKDSIAYGYYLQVTTLQLARAYAAIASGGTLPSVRIERAKGSPDGDWHRLASGRGHRAMSARSAELLTEWLKDVVEGDRGSGAAAAVHGYSVAGKTGTAWVGKDRGGYLEGVHRATFAGFAPAENPRAVVVVTFDQASRNGTGGGSVAAPCFSKVMAETLRLLRVPPSDLRVADADDVARGGRG
jgi:cell division protein FtsI (penicillin-binding protein 3)